MDVHDVWVVLRRDEDWVSEAAAGHRSEKSGSLARPHILETSVLIWRSRCLASRESSLLSANLDKSWARRVAVAKKYNASLADGTIPVPFRRRVQWAMLPARKRAARELAWRTTWGRKQPQLYLAIVEQFRSYYFLAVPFKVVGDACQLMVGDYRHEKPAQTDIRRQ